MKELSRNDQTPILAPVEQLRLGGKVDEYRLVGEPTCLKKILDFLCNGKRAIWTSPSACIFRSLPANIKIPATFDIQMGNLGFKKYNEEGKFLESPRVSIMGKAREDRLDCFEFLIRLPDTVYDGVYLGGPAIPLTPRVLKVLLERKPRKGRYFFERRCLSAECGRLLATSGSETQLTFSDGCRFEDGGKAFVDALSERQDETEGPSEVTLDPNELFDEEYQHKFFLVFQKTSLQNLSLRYGTSLDEHASRLVTLARTRMLSLSFVQLADGGEALAASIRRGHGPRGLQILYSTKILKTILDAVGDEKALIEEFIIENCTLDPKRVAGALERNRSLRHFELRFFITNRPSWERVLQAICAHPTLQTLQFKCVTITTEDADSGRRQRTEDLAIMLSTNPRIRDVAFCSTTFDRARWNDGVAPLLECNRWRHNIVCHLWRIEPESTRASLLAVCLSKVAAGSNTNPSAVNLLLSSNQGLVASYGGGAHD